MTFLADPGRRLSPEPGRRAWPGGRTRARGPGGGAEPLASLLLAHYEVIMLRAFWVVVIRADRPDVIARLRRLLAGAAWVQIVVDRRRADRRRTAPAAGRPDPERRRADRRRTSREASGAPYRLIQSAEGYQVLQSQSRASVRCPDCGSGSSSRCPA